MAGSLTRWDPFGERFDRVFDEFAAGGERAWTPAIDVVRSNGDLVVKANLPGITPEEVKIAVEDDVITVSGEHEEHKEEKDKHFVRRERHYGSFLRSIALPPGIDPKKIKASTRDGVLEVTVPLPKDARKEKVEITPAAG